MPKKSQVISVCVCGGGEGVGVEEEWEVGINMDFHILDFPNGMHLQYNKWQENWVYTPGHGIYTIDGVDT